MGLSVLNCSEQSAHGMQEKHEQTECKSDKKKIKRDGLR